MLHFGDCMKLLPNLPAQSVDLVLADLPWGTTNCRWDCPLPLEALWTEYNRVCRGAIVLFAGAPFDKILGASNIRNLRYEWIWEKGNATGHLNAKRAPMKAHETILVFGKSQPCYNPVMTHGHVRKTAHRRNGTASPIYNAADDPTYYSSTSRYPRSIIRFSSEKQRGGMHPTQKPLALCEYLVKTHSNPGDIVLDNCMGSGTTGVAALRNGRSFIGMEDDPAFFSMAKTRIEALTELV